MPTRYKTRNLRNLRVSEFVHICENAESCKTCPLFVPNNIDGGTCIIHSDVNIIKRKYHKIIHLKYRYKYLK